MATSSAGNKPESHRLTFFPVAIIYAVALLAFVSSCRQNQPDKNKAVTLVDSVAIRQQQQRLTDSIAKVQAAKKKLYLTFDDGPNRGTRNVLKAVQDENIPVSFFVVGKHVFDSPQQTQTFNLLKEDSTIELCNHSYTHALNRYSIFYQHPDDVVKDFQRSQQQLNFQNTIVRMPGRNAWRIDSIDVTDVKESKAAIDAVHQAGFAVMGWDIEWTFDHKTLTPDSDTDLLLRRIFNMLDAGTTQTPGHLVLLAHDQAFQKAADIEKLHAFIQELKNNPDYELVVASKYPGVVKK